MKYSTLRAFEKHLESASPHHLSLLYLLIAKDDFERKAACEKIVGYALDGKGKAGISICIYDAAEANGLAIIEELLAFSFFAPKKVVVVQQADKLSKDAQERLRTYFLKPNKAVYLVLSAASLNRATNLYKDAEKAGVVFDAAEEKPWEKEKSIQVWIHEQLGKEGKTIDASAVQLLAKQLGADKATLHQELEKLLCFTGERTSITTADVAAVCASVSQETAWLLGDALFTLNTAEALRVTKSLLSGGTALIALLRQIRSQFQTGYQVCCLLANGKTGDEVGKQFPYMRGATLNRHVQNAQAYGLKRFKTGILNIDETELLAKSSGGEPEWLAERLIFRLTSK